MDRFLASSLGKATFVITAVIAAASISRFAKSESPDKQVTDLFKFNRLKAGGGGGFSAITPNALNSRFALG